MKIKKVVHETRDWDGLFNDLKKIKKRNVEWEQMQQDKKDLERLQANQQETLKFYNGANSSKLKNKEPNNKTNNVVPFPTRKKNQ